ncbi:MAG: hypothetical protein RQ729_00610 [Wenzhouxiangellaceae bacterium]|nr:hypothetical protein [Wenzhouxiangellaceae bacterium]
MTRTNRTVGALAIVLYWAVTTFAHLPVSLWLVKRRESEWLGTFQLTEFLPALALFGVAGLLAHWTLRALACRDPWPTLVAWALWLACIAPVDRFLLYSFPEYLHYPQYALLGWLLARWLDPARRGHGFGIALLAGTLLGMVDEILQYVWLTISYSNYLDFNDFILNLLGTVAGLLVYYGFRDRPSDGGAFTATGVATTGFIALGLVLWTLISMLTVQANASAVLPWIERELSYGTWIRGPHAGHYYVLPPAIGTLLLVGAGLAFTQIGRAITRSGCRAA